MSEKKEIIVPKWVAGFLIVLGVLGGFGIANSVPPATGSNQTAAKALPSYCADGYHDNIVECGWTPERQRAADIKAENDAAGAEFAARVHKAWSEQEARCENTPSAMLSHNETERCNKHALLPFSDH